MDWLAGARGVVLALLVLVGSPATVFAQPNFPPLTGRVVDNADMLSAATEQKLTGELEQLEAQTGRQMVVATIPDLQGYEIEEYGYQLGRAWGIGQKGEDNGVVFLVAPAERKVRIEVGYGLEGVLTDALSNVILQQRVLPYFRQGQMEQGVVSGTEAVIQQLALPDEEAKARVAQAAAAPRPAQSDGGGGFALIFFLFIAFWVLSGILGAFGRGRRRRRGSSGLWWLLPILMSGGGGRHRGGGWGGGGFGGGGFSGGGGSFGGGGSSGSW
ncbi:YgcG family protein [Phenylobacterium sp.]|uniref:TPM domain-containing protein n=1 Tax=Phenylobacterium sp. TaxID=1871053 RepID=UPI0035B108A6